MIQTIIEAVHKVTGVSFEQFTGPEKKREKYFARLMFSYFCMKHTKMDYRQISVIVKRNPSTVFRYREFFKNEKKVNSGFREMVLSIEEKLIVHQCDT